MTVVIHLITVIKWELFRKYHIKQCVFRGWRLKKNILSFHTAWTLNRLPINTSPLSLWEGGWGEGIVEITLILTFSVSARLCLLDNCSSTIAPALFYYPPSMAVCVILLTGSCPNESFSVSVPDSTLPIPSLESYHLHPCKRPALLCLISPPTS